MKKSPIILLFLLFVFCLPQGARAITCGFGSDIGGGVCRGYITSGSTFTVPSDWNSGNNTIEVVGGGAGGGVGYYNPSTGAAAVSSGGGGGAYSEINNLTLTPNSTLSLSVGSAGTGGGYGGNTYFDGPGCSQSSVCAQGGSPGVVGSGTIGTGGAGGAGGSSAAGVGRIKYSGGSGSPSILYYCAEYGSDAGFAGGGGGAAGPNGNGVSSNAGSPNCDSGILGGAGDAGYGGAGSSAGIPGYSGTEWSASYGSGGGAGGTCAVGSPIGGAYGGGGGGTCIQSNGGGGGLIVITYTPALECSITLTPTSVQYGSSTATLSYFSSGATSFYINNVGYVGASGSTMVAPSATTDYSGNVAASSTSQASQTFATPGTYSFTVPSYTTLTVTVNGAGGGGAGSQTGTPGATGGTSSFAGNIIGYGGGGGSTGAGTPGTASGGSTNTTGGGATGGPGQGNYLSSSGGSGGQAIKSYGQGLLTPNSVITVVVGAGGAGGAGSIYNPSGVPGANGSVSISWSSPTASATASCPASLTVNAPGAPTATIAASSTSILSNQSTNITADFQPTSSTTTTTSPTPTVIYLTSGSTWQVPSNWNSASNTIEAIGGGGGGDANWGNGGGGGAYSKVSDLNISGTVSYQIGGGGTAGGTTIDGSDNDGPAAGSGGGTWFVNSSTLFAAGGAGGGLPEATPGAGGSSSSGVGSTKYSGGSGGGGNASAGAGGGGAAGPNGNGVSAAATSGTNYTVSTAGGAGDAGNGGAGGSTLGGTGGIGAEWGSPYGSGGGGGGSGIGDNHPAAGAGGNYGGGGGGSCLEGGDGCSPRAGASGLIVITYYPLVNDSVDPFIADNIDSPVGTGLGANTNPTTSKTILFSTTTPGTYTFYARAETSYFSNWLTLASTTITVTQAIVCTPASQYICGGSGNETVIASSTNSFCQNSQTPVTSCVSPAFCQSGASSCQYPAIIFNPLGNQTGQLQLIPNIVHPGDSTQVYWNVSNAQSCTVTGSNGDSWTGLSSPTGGYASGPVNTLTTYKLSCLSYGSNPNVSETQTVNITPTYREQ